LRANQHHTQYWFPCSAESINRTQSREDLFTTNDSGAGSAMSLKQEIETWVAALAAYDNHEFDNSLKCFETIADTSKILFNCGVIHATLGQHQEAIQNYQRAVQLDQYLAIAYFQQGVSNFLMGDFEEALANFNDTLLYLRGNKNIDYDQLGLKFKLYSCEVLFNRGLCYIYLQQMEPGLQDLDFARQEKMVKDHDVIDEAIKDRAEGYTVFSIPVGVVYRPSEAKVKNLPTKDYLGKARLVAEERDFMHSDPRRSALAALALDDRPGEKLSYAAMNMVRSDLRSRARQQSEPPLQRNLFPPTPPPEPERHERVDRSDTFSQRRQSNDSMASERSRMSLQSARPGAKPLRLELGVAAFEQKSQQQQQQQQIQSHRSVQPQPQQQQYSPPQQQQSAFQQSKPRIAPKRSESERPPQRQDHYGGSFRQSGSRRADYRFSETLVEEDPIEAYSEAATQDQSYLQRPVSSQTRPRSGNPRHQPVPIEEEDEDDYDEVDYSPDGGAYGSPPLAFEIVPPRSSLNVTSPNSGQPRHRSTSRRPAAPPPPEVKKIRIKVHGGDDMRYVMTTPSATYEALEEQIRAKFGLRTAGFKLKIRDEEGDMVTMGDQDDWEMTISVAKAAANKERVDMAKMEMWVQEI
jgi:tetratricopeptide (TPR) repeat protein